MSRLFLGLCFSLYLIYLYTVLGFPNKQQYHLQLIVKAKSYAFSLFYPVVQYWVGVGIVGIFVLDFKGNSLHNLIIVFYVYSCFLTATHINF